MAKYNGAFAEKFTSFNRPVKSLKPGRDGNPRTVRENLDTYTFCTLMGKLGEKPADEETGQERSVTLSIALASANQLRRITGFGAMADQMDKLKLGAVIECSGTTLIAGNGAPAALNGMKVDQLVEVTPEQFKMIIGHEIPWLTEQKKLAAEEVNREQADSTLPDDLT